jgi:hypothetical protein
VDKSLFISVLLGLAGGIIWSLLAILYLTKARSYFAPIVFKLLGPLAFLGFLVGAFSITYFGLRFLYILDHDHLLASMFACGSVMFATAIYFVRRPHS